ncbi:MAG: GNAT family N-acetyltransferase [Bacteroidetes bacterium]|nr:GNAT family N-acetyltransferase [Bacteroidota bacterium]MBL0064322.1 GNAT family N-acetyltransferase [Bacteroidota bacterium]MBL0139297.1 GNAT family N-acetyltransferase [Bacteroidota bacterium]
MIQPIQTKRLLLRQITEKDARSMFELNEDPDVVRYTGNKGYRDLQEVLDFIHSYDQYEKYKVGRMTMIESSTGEYIGWCGLKFLEEINEIDIGYRLKKKYWGKGYATESSIAILDYGFLSLGLKRIVGRAIRDNVKSTHILKKLGMKFEKEFEEHGYICEQYVLTGPEWKEIRKSFSGKNE